MKAIRKRTARYCSGVISWSTPALCSSSSVLFLADTKRSSRERKVKLPASGRKIRKISLCTGAGSEFIAAAAENGSDLYITGDISYHDAQLAYDYDIALIDATHYASENLITEVLKKRLKNAFPELDVIKSEFDGQPFMGL